MFVEIDALLLSFSYHVGLQQDNTDCDKNENYYAEGCTGPKVFLRCIVL